MIIFNRNSIVDLKKHLYHDYSHDAILKSFTYNGNGESAKIEFFNPFFKVNTTMVFNDIEVVLVVKGEWYGSRETILGLVAEDDFSYLQTYLPKCNECSEDSLYLLFQMFSGDELHIVAKEVMIDITK